MYSCTASNVSDNIGYVYSEQSSKNVIIITDNSLNNIFENVKWIKCRVNMYRNLISVFSIVELMEFDLGSNWINEIECGSHMAAAVGICQWALGIPAGCLHHSTNRQVHQDKTYYITMVSLENIDGLVQEKCNPSVLAMELCISCNNPSIG